MRTNRTKPLTFRPAESVAPSLRWAIMPHVDGRAITHARAKMALIRAALTGAGAVVAVFRIDQIDTRHRRYCCTLWRADGMGGYRIDPSDGAIGDAVVSQICGALSDMARDLSARWPASARPPAIGMVTDGHRIVFNAAHPAATGADWLLDHVCGASPATILVDDGGEGHLDILCPRAIRGPNDIGEKR